jgi:endonuclease YncB( thermonuclease family)
MDVCLEQIKRGFAWHYKAYELEQTDEDRVSYAIAEVRARNAKVGLWVERQNAIPPWNWRSRSF